MQPHTRPARARVAPAAARPYRGIAATRLRPLRLVLRLLPLLLVAAPARAQLSWVINEVFTTADGSVQFIELREDGGLDGQDQLDGREILVLGGAMELDSLTLSGDLPSPLTADAFFLVGTSNLADPPFSVEPNYVIPPGFIDPVLVDRIDFVGIDVLLISQGDLPTDGTNSLNRGAGSLPASPMTSFVPEPPAGALRLAGLAAVLLLARRRQRA